MNLLVVSIFHPTTQDCVATIRQGSVKIHNKFLENRLKSFGISVPSYQRGSFGGKPTIHITDPQFNEAFRAIYLMTLKEQGFRVLKGAGI